MQVHELLENRKTEIISEIQKLQNELAEIERAMNVLRTAPQMAAPQVQATGGGTHGGVMTMPATKDEAIIQAIGNGCRTPAAISDFIRTRLGMPVNDASTRTRLSRMKASDKIAHDGSGWKLKGNE
ncbi:hypothetical protein [Ensifer aridi]|uniref:hypothetical protein n=1 Tax=Ensifer aridi TaxID=1708715 RepID=UPI000A0FCD0B|nr:hypothetical protein [Ensifer aridi]